MTRRLHLVPPLRQDLPPVSCAPWCEAHDGHPHEIFIEDQRCYSPADIVTGRADTDVQVCASRHADGRPAGVCVVIASERGEVGVELAVHEAQHLIALLHGACDLARTAVAS